MSGTIATDSNLSATGTITLSLSAQLATRYNYNTTVSSVTISSLAAGTYLLHAILTANDNHTKGTFSVSGASALVAFPEIDFDSPASPHIYGRTYCGVYTVASTGDVTVSLSSYTGYTGFAVTATPLTT